MRAIQTEIVSALQKVCSSQNVRSAAAYLIGLIAQFAARPRASSGLVAVILIASYDIDDIAEWIDVRYLSSKHPR